MAQPMPPQTQQKPQVANVQTTASDAKKAKRIVDKSPQAAKARLQVGLDRAVYYIHDGPSSFSVRARRAAKRGIPRETAEKGLQVIAEALRDATAEVNRAYTMVVDEPKKSRVQL